MTGPSYGWLVYRRYCANRRERIAQCSHSPSGRGRRDPLIVFVGEAALEVWLQLSRPAGYVPGTVRRLRAQQVIHGAGLHVLFAGAFAGCTVMVLVLVQLLDFPFEGGLHLSNIDFVRLLNEVSQMLAGR